MTMYEPFLRETFFHTYVSDGIVSIAFWASLSAPMREDGVLKKRLVL